MGKALGGTGLHIKHLVLVVNVVILVGLMRRNVKVIVGRLPKDGELQLTSTKLPTGSKHLIDRHIILISGIMCLDHG